MTLLREFFSLVEATGTWPKWPPPGNPGSDEMAIIETIRQYLEQAAATEQSSQVALALKEAMEALEKASVALEQG